MLNDINYAVTPSSVNLGEVSRRHLRREWSYFFDSIIKVFSGKVSNFDVYYNINATNFLQYFI